MRDRTLTLHLSCKTNVAKVLQSGLHITSLNAADYDGEWVSENRPCACKMYELHVYWSGGTARRAEIAAIHTSHANVFRHVHRITKLSKVPLEAGYHTASNRLLLIQAANANPLLGLQALTTTPLWHTDQHEHKMRDEPTVVRKKLTQYAAR